MGVIEKQREQNCLVYFLTTMHNNYVLFCSACMCFMNRLVSHNSENAYDCGQISTED